MRSSMALWFAWKLVLLQYRKQPIQIDVSLSRCCDLLENSYFCSIANNVENFKIEVVIVVICLKTRTFAVSQTTWHNYMLLFLLLWFAWKLVLLQYRKQHSPRIAVWTLCCDLLENSYFCSIANNLEIIAVFLISVVICLKTRTFAVSQTTLPTDNVSKEWLWFAWKLVLLQYRKQPSIESCKIHSSCDLLENSYFCSIANNSLHGHAESNQVVICLKTRTFAVSQTTSQRAPQRVPVVICLKTRTFAVSQTTTSNVISLSLSLWFAWKLVLLQYRKQLLCSFHWMEVCCDLLENSYFCSIANNWLDGRIFLIIVVICLKTRTFAVSQTTLDVDKKHSY